MIKKKIISCVLVAAMLASTCLSGVKTNAEQASYQVENENVQSEGILATETDAKIGSDYMTDDELSTLEDKSEYTIDGESVKASEKLLVDATGQYEYMVRDGEAYFRGYKGDKEEITIPDKIDGYDVVRIVMVNETGKAKKITFPRTLKRIAAYAIDKNVEEITIPAECEYVEILENAFGLANKLRVINCSENTYFEYIDIPNNWNYGTGLRNTKWYTSQDELVYLNNLFVGCIIYSRVEKLEVREGTTVLEPINTPNIDEIVLPEGIKTLGVNTINVSHLKKISIPESVEYIGEKCFYYDEDLEEIIIPANVKKIDNLAFSKCYSLKNIIILGDETSFGTDVFESCENVNIIARKGSVAEAYAKENATNNLSFEDFNTSKYAVSKVSFDKSTISMNVGDAPKKLGVTIAPDTAANKNIKWTNSNPAVATVDENGNVTPKKEGTTVITATSKDGTNKKASCTVTVKCPDIKVSYRTHVQTYGWQGYVSNGQMSGTSGEAKRLEGINIKVSGNSNLGIQYTTHCQTYGWLPWSCNDEMSGTSGEAKRLEAIKIQLTGSAKDYYDIYYRVHAQSYGWLNWAKNGAPAGTAGYAKRLEGIQIVVVKKGTAINTKMGNIVSINNAAYVSKTNDNPVIKGAESPYVIYRTHVQSYGWQNWVNNGVMSGTSGEAKRLEGIEIKLSNKPCSGGITYRTHIQSIGWEKDWKSNGAMSGTSGQAKRLEAIEIKLTGEMANKYDVYYRVHAQSYGWLDWAKNGQSAGTEGLGKRLEGIEIVLVPKGGKAPGKTTRPLVKK